MTDLTADLVIGEVARILQEVWNAQTAFGFFDDLQHAVFRLLEWPSSDFELRAKLDSIILVSAKYFLPLDAHVAMLYVKMIKW
jgi:hypothetical protein